MSKDFFNLSPDALTKIILNVVLVFSCTAFGGWVGSRVGEKVYDFQSSDTRVSWQLLDSPVRFKQIDAILFSDIVAKSTDEMTYTRECTTSNECKWTRTQDFKIVYDQMNKKGTTCQFEGISGPKDPQGNVVECVFTSWATGEGYGVDYYALLDDGKVWHWGHSIDGFGYFVTIDRYTSLGFGSGFMVGLLLMYLNYKKKLHITPLSV
jgi:hypothetical protein